MNTVSNEHIVGLVQKVIDSGETSTVCLSQTEKKLNHYINNLGPIKVCERIKEITTGFHLQINRVLDTCTNAEAIAALREIDEIIHSIEPESVFSIIVDVIETLSEHLGSRVISYRSGNGKHMDEVGPDSSIPSSINTDKLRHKLEEILFYEDIHFILYCIRRGQPKQISKFGQNLPVDKQAPFFRVMSDFFPDDMFYLLFLGRAAIDHRDREAGKEALDRLMKHNLDQHTLPIAANLARIVNDDKTAWYLLEKLEKELNHENCVPAFAKLAYYLHDKSRMQRAMILLEKSDSDTSKLVVYAKIVFVLGFENKMHAAMMLLEDLLNNPSTVKQYAKLAYAMNDDRAMLIALQATEKYLTYKWFITMYAIIARKLNHIDAMEKIREILVDHVEDPACKRSFDMVNERLENAKSFQTHV